jgi:hypothetical protein
LRFLPSVGLNGLNGLSGLNGLDRGISARADGCAGECKVLVHLVKSR